MDEHALDLIQHWATNRNINTLYIAAVEDLENFKDDLMKADKLFIISYTRTIEILHWIWKHNLEAESVYDILENEQIYLQMEFYRFIVPLKKSPELGLLSFWEEKSVDGSSLTLYEYYYQKQRLFHSKDEEDKTRIREKLFFLSICMRNFIEAKRILDELYCADEFNRYWEEQENLFVKIKELLAERKQNSIVIYWLDAMLEEESDKFEYLKDRRAHSLYFENAFTVTPYTNPTCKAMFCGIRQVDDLGYKVNSINADNSPLLRDIGEQNYRFSLISDYLSRLFEPAYSHCIGNTKISPCSEVFWDLLDQVIVDEHETVYLAHTLMELHNPKLSVRREQFEDEYEYQFNDQLFLTQRQELNDQLRFYDEMIGDNFYRIYMSDHGRTHDVRWAFHIYLQIYHKTWSQRRTDKLFCFLDFSKIMHQLLTGKEIDDSVWDRDYVPVQDVDHYSKNVLKALLRINTYPITYLSGYKGVADRKGIYLHFKTGDELYNKWTELDKDPIFYVENPDKDSEIFAEMSKTAGWFPEQISQDPKFQYSAYIYEIYENVKKTTKCIANLINDKLEKYEDGSIALRMGGNHSWHLYSILTEASRKKIGCIIDNNPKCLCSRLNIPVVSQNEILGCEVQNILLSSFFRLEELQNEAKKIYKNMNIINIYNYWESLGFRFNNDFWYGLDQDHQIDL